MKNNSCLKKILSLILVLSMLTGVYCCPLTAFASEDVVPRLTVDPFENVTRVPATRLLSNKVKNAAGNWVASNGVYHSKWDKYNCYGYAIHLPNYIKAGFMSNGNYVLGTATVQEVAELAKDDLEAMGYLNVALHSEIPTINETQELICLRKTSSQSQSTDFHYMRYDYATDAWYHKPSKTAVLKYNHTPTNDVIWSLETVEAEGIFNYPLITYSGEIIFITYSRNLLTVGESATKSINPGKEILCEVNIETTGEYTLRFSSAYSVEYTLYNADLDAIMSGNEYSEAAGFQANAGTYYLRMKFQTDNANVGQVNVSITSEHTHSYTAFYVRKSDTTHWSYCTCGDRISQVHVVSSSNKSVCMLCNGIASGGLLNSIPADLPHTENGSYILPNGIIVLVPEDQEAYFNGTLIFRTGEVVYHYERRCFF